MKLTCPLGTTWRMSPESSTPRPSPQPPSAGRCRPRNSSQPKQREAGPMGFVSPSQNCTAGRPASPIGDQPRAGGSARPRAPGSTPPSWCSSAGGRSRSRNAAQPLQHIDRSVVDQRDAVPEHVAGRRARKERALPDAEGRGGLDRRSPAARRRNFLLCARRSFSSVVQDWPEAGTYRRSSCRSEGRRAEVGGRIPRAAGGADEGRHQGRTDQSPAH